MQQFKAIFKTFAAEFDFLLLALILADSTLIKFYFQNVGHLSNICQHNNRERGLVFVITNTNQINDNFEQK